MSSIEEQRRRVRERIERLKRRNAELAKKEKSKKIEETSEEGITEQDIRKRKMALMDEIEARLKKEKGQEYIESIVEEEERKQDALFKEDLKKRYEIALDHYKLMLSDSFAAYKNILDAVQEFSKVSENNSLVLVFEGLPNNECRLLFKILHSGKIENPNQIRIAKEK
jgi:hypothetical protein